MHNNPKPIFVFVHSNINIIVTRDNRQSRLFIWTKQFANQIHNTHKKQLVKLCVSTTEPGREYHMDLCKRVCPIVLPTFVVCRLRIYLPICRCEMRIIWGKAFAFVVWEWRCSVFVNCCFTSPPPQNDIAKGQSCSCLLTGRWYCGLRCITISIYRCSSFKVNWRNVQFERNSFGVKCDLRYVANIIYFNLDKV